MDVKLSKLDIRGGTSNDLHRSIKKFKNKNIITVLFVVFKFLYILHKQVFRVSSTSSYVKRISTRKQNIINFENGSQMTDIHKQEILKKNYQNRSLR